MIKDIGFIPSSDGSQLLRMWNVTVEPGERGHRRHSHLCFEIGTVLKGDGIYAVGDKSYDIHPNDVFVFASNEQHCITNVEKDGLEILNMQFEPRYLWGNSQDSLSEANIGFCFSHSDDFENRISSNQSEKLLYFLKEIESEFKSRASEYALAVKSLLNMIAVTLIRDFGYSSEKMSLSRSNLHSIRRVILHIDKNLSEEMDLSSLAQIAGMSPNYFSALFHRVSGITLWEYINSRRIDKAIHLICEDEPKNILDIALLCGFNNTANFNKTFKKVTAMTPTEYRSSGEILVR